MGLIINSPIDRLSISTTVNYISEKFTNSENTIGVASHYTDDARVEYEIRKYLLFFQIDNMFDKEFIRPFLIPGKPRFFYTGVKYSIKPFLYLLT